MSRGLSSAEAALKRSANAETIDVTRMICSVVVLWRDGSQVPMICLHSEEARVACDERKWIPVAGYLQAVADP